MGDNIVELGVDTGDGTGKIAALTTQLKRLVTAQTELTVTSEKYNAKGKTTQLVLQALDQTTGKLIVTYKVVKGELVAIAAATDRATQKFKQLQSAQASIREGALANRQSGRRSTEAEAIRAPLAAALRGSNNAGIASTSELKAFDTAVKGIIGRVTSGSSAEEINGLFTRFKAGATDFTAKEREIITLFQAGINAANNFGTAAANAVNRAGRSSNLTNQFTPQQIASIKQQQAASTAANQKNLAQGQAAASAAFGNQLSSASPKQVVAFNNALQSSYKLLGQGKVSAQQFSQAISNVKGNNLQQNLTGPLNTIQSGIQRANAALTTFGRTGARAGSQILLSFQSVIRIFQSQLLYRAFALITQGITESIKASAEYARRIALIQTITQDVTIRFDEWYTSIRKVADSFGIGVVEAATAAYDLLSNQITRGAETSDVLATAFAFARTTNSSATDSVNLFSSAINSFELKASDADRVARTFFTTIDLGRVTATELANSFGRSGTLANALGLQLEELQATITVLTRQGVKVNEAYTLVNNLFLKLLKPTPALSGYLKNLGYESGQAAIAAEGLEGVLGLLDKEFDGDVSKIAKYFNQIRGARGVINLTGKALQDFKDDLDKLRNSGTAFDVAKEKVNEGFGQKFFDQSEKIKNFFIVDVGHKFAEALVNLNDNLKATFGNDFTGLISKAINLMKVLVAATIAFYVQKGFNSVIFGYQGIIAAIQGMIAGYGAMATSIAAVVAGNASLLVTPYGAIAGALALLVAGVVAATVAYNVYVETAEDAYKRELAAAQEGTAKIIEVEQKSADKLTAIHAAAINKNKQASLKYAAEQRADANDLADALKDAQKEVTDSIANSYERLKGILSNTLSSMEGDVKSSFDTVKKVAEEIQDVKDSFSTRTFEGRLDRLKQSGDVEGQRKLLQGQINKNIEERAAAADRGDLPALKAKYKEYLNLVDRLEGLSVRIRTFRIVPGTKKVTEPIVGGGGATHKVLEERDRIVPNGSVAVPAVAQGNAEQLRRRGARDQLILLQKVGDQAAKTGGQQQTAADAYKEKLQGVEGVFKKIGDFQKTVFDKNGQPKGDFAKPGGTAKAVEQLQALHEEALSRLRDAGQSVPEAERTKENFKQDILKLTAQLGQQGNLLSAQLGTATQLADLAAKTKEIAEAAKAAESAMRGFRDAISASTKTTADLKAKLSPLATLLQGTSRQFGPAEAFSSTAGSFAGILSKLKELSDKAVTPADFEAINKLADHAQKLLDEIDARNARDKLGIKPLGGRELVPANEQTGEKAKTIQSTLTEFKDAAKGIGTGLSDLQTLSAQLSKAQQSLAGIAEKSLPAGAALKGALDPIVGLSAQVAENLERIRNAQVAIAQAPAAIKGLQQSSGVTPTPRVVGPDDEEAPADHARGGLVRRFASGGFLNDFFSGRYASGTDTVPTMLTPGEFVTNAKATRQFLPILKAINAGKLTGAAGTINHSTTNVGDINVNVNGGNNTDATVQDIAQSIRRGLRRGTIKL